MKETEIKQGSLLDIVGVFVKWRRLLTINFFLAAIIVYIIALFLPKWYQSSAVIFPPEQESGGIGLTSSLLGGGLGALMSGGGMALPTFASLSDVYAAVLKSRVVAEGVIKKNNLMEVFNTQSLEQAVASLHGRTAVAVQPEGIIRIDCEDRDPERAAAIAGSFVDELNRVNREVRASRARDLRQFIEERLDQTKEELAAAEEEFRAFQEKNKTISLDAQVSALIGNLAELKSRLVLAEIELGVLKRSFLPTHTQVKQQEATIEEIKKQIKLLEEGSPDKIKDSPLSIPFAEAPDLSLQLVRLTRKLKIQEAIFELLTQQYEQAKIQEKKDTSTIRVLDPPKVPERRSRPRRATMALMAGMLSVLFTSIAVFVKEFIDRNKQADTATYHFMEDMLKNLKNDFYAIRSIFMFKKQGGNDRNG
jgi:tyrosine-protein kinase Etk/Wzc